MSDSRFDRLEGKLDIVVDKISSIEVTLVSQHAVLQEHIARTKALEAIVEPLHTDALMAKGAYKLLGWMGASVGFISACYEILSYYRRR